MIRDGQTDGRTGGRTDRRTGKNNMSPDPSVGDIKTGETGLHYFALKHKPPWQGRALFWPSIVYHQQLLF